MKELTEEEKRKITERYKAIRRGEIKAEYVGIPDEFRIEEEERRKKEKPETEHAHSIGYLYSKGLYLAWYRPRPKEDFWINKESINPNESKEKPTEL
jgi:hypothetical protein